ncbi:tropomyosin beta chain [Exaiptasia diaphana]|uniref:Uncharacterized protein n=1 Tax=Exaiptasia diaphana TaxID=2652724 RepID=A0A913Y885_EXADI|nr:tropomyosin beta chain [Exaiptasia diaphana]KXJ06551.1 hypothetical protein AC249_AIPGENE14588 [Exaiptasia diaphana]
MALVKKDVVIGEETFYLDKIPDAKTALVRQAKDALLGAVDLKGLVTDLSKLGSFIRVAYNGVAGHTELQIKVQRVGYKITKLADKSAVTVHSFKTTSRDVLQELQGTYEYLLDGLEDMALATLSGLAALAEKMAKASEELHKDFEAATSDVQGALEDTQTAKGTEEKRKKELEKQREEFKMKLEKAQNLKKEANEAEEKAQKFFDEAQKREDKAYEDQGSILKAFTNTVSKVISAGVSAASLNPKNVLENISEIGDKTVYKEAMDKAREEKMKHLETMKEQQKMRREANQQCIEFAERIKNCRSDDELAQVAIDALHNSVGALKSLSVIMMNAAQFWKQMQTHCEALAGEEVQKQIETAVEKCDEARRMKIWTSSAFKKKAINYYAKWVALDEVCGNYMQQIKDTRGDLYKYLEENPTIEQSRRNVRDLAITFMKDLQKAQNDLEKKDLQTAQEIKELKE